ncbi:MAG: hypothetical protein HC802_08095, partial [Caldilineaceae bacterium]|nr:hypothetical protein [Caldilineaceae bacterium]
LDLFQGSEARLPWKPAAPETGLFALRRRPQVQSRSNLPPITTEYAVTAAASLARYFLMRNRAVGISSRGHTREFLQADRGERQLNKILEALAVVEAVGNLPFAHLIATDGVRLNRNDTVIAISADPSPDWAVALQQIQRRGVNSIAVVVDGSSFGAAHRYDQLLGGLEASGIATYKVTRDTPLEQALGQPVSSGNLKVRR